MSSIGKPALVLSSIFMTLPAMIPFYFAMQAEGQTRWLLIGTGFVVAIANACMLVMIHRWITRYLQP